MRVHTQVEAAVSRVVHGGLKVATKGAGFTDLSVPIVDWLAEIEADAGILSAFVTHTTASLVIQENADPSVKADLLDHLGTLAPASSSYRHNDEGPDDMPAHIKALLAPAGLVVPCVAGRLVLGTWQSIYLLEHRTGHRTRTVALTYCGS